MEFKKMDSLDQSKLTNSKKELLNITSSYSSIYNGKLTTNIEVRTAVPRFVILILESIPRGNRSLIRSMAGYVPIYDLKTALLGVDCQAEQYINFSLFEFLVRTSTTILPKKSTVEVTQEFRHSQSLMESMSQRATTLSDKDRAIAINFLAYQCDYRNKDSLLASAKTIYNETQ